LHPFEKDDARRQTYLDREKVAHIILNYWWEGNLLWGTVETAATRAGRDFQGLIRQGCGVSFSMRGLGGHTYKNKDGYEVVDKDLFIYCYDNVDFPSHDKAYIQNILKEDYDVSAKGNTLNEDFNILGKKEIVVPDSEDDLKNLIESTSSDSLRSKYRKIYDEEAVLRNVDNFIMSL
jgi:hypothetical protein